MRASIPAERRSRSIPAPALRLCRPNRRLQASAIDHKQRWELAVVPVIPVSLAVQLCLALVALGLLVFAMAAMQQLWNR